VINNKETLTYDDVLLMPQYSDIESRKEIDISNNLDNNIHLTLPIISAPMDTVTGAPMTIAMSNAGGLGIIHRYNSIEEQVKEVAKTFSYTTSVPQWLQVGAAIGVIGNFEERACALYDAGARILCIDVAHGHHILVERAIKTLKDIFGDKIHIMAGNVATPEGYKALSSWGADSARCNVGGGSICSTRIQTGHGIPGLQTIINCAQHKKNKTKIIADGGIRTSGDIVKAIAAGADFVMVGSLLAGTEESPGKLITTRTGEKRKVYRGMASKEAQFDWKRKYSSNEGISTTVPYKGNVKNILNDLSSGIKSGLSYSGCRNIFELQENAIFIRQTNAGLIESNTHILGKNNA
jgi:IMP dehydrogenase